MDQVYLTKELDPGSSTWFHIDSTGHEQGPFTSEEMLGWYQAGDLPSNLLLRRASQSYFRRLYTLMYPAQFGSSSIPAGILPSTSQPISPSATFQDGTNGFDPSDHANIPLKQESGHSTDYSWKTRGKRSAVKEEEDTLDSKFNSTQPDTESLQSEPLTLSDNSVDFLRNIKIAFNKTFSSSRSEECDQVNIGATESFQKDELRIKKESMKSSGNFRTNVSEDLSGNCRIPKVNIKKEYIKDENNFEFPDTVNEDFVGNKDANMNLCVNHSEVTKQEMQEHKVKSPRKRKEIKKEYIKISKKDVKKPSQNDSNLVKVKKRSVLNFNNQYRDGKSNKQDKNGYWQCRYEDSKTKVDKKRSKCVASEKGISRHRQENRRFHNSKYFKEPFSEWKCPRLNCGAIIMRRSVICIACSRENPCEGVCQTEGCGQFNWISMMACPNCHKD